MAATELHLDFPAAGVQGMGVPASPGGGHAAAGSWGDRCTKEAGRQSKPLASIERDRTGTEGAQSPAASAGGSWLVECGAEQAISWQKAVAGLRTPVLGRGPAIGESSVGAGEERGVPDAVGAPEGWAGASVASVFAVSAAHSVATALASRLPNEKPGAAAIAWTHGENALPE